MCMVSINVSLMHAGHILWQRAMYIWWRTALTLTFIFYLLFYWLVIAETATHSVANNAQNLLSHPAVWAVVAEKKPQHPAKQILASVWCLNRGSQPFDRFIRGFPVVLILSAATPASPLSHSVWLILAMKYTPKWRQGDTHEESRNAVPTGTEYLVFYIR